MRDEVIKEAIASRAVDSNDAGRIADAAVTALTLLHAELGMVVGSQAAAALVSHAMHRTRTRIEWTMPAEAAFTGKSLAALRDDLAARPPLGSLYAAETLLFALVDHLISLIGEPLTARMLQKAWSAGDAPDATPTSQEILK